MSVQFQVKQYRAANLNLPEHQNLLREVLGIPDRWPCWEFFPDGRFFVSMGIPENSSTFVPEASARKAATVFLEDLQGRIALLAKTQKKKFPLLNAFNALRPGEVEAVEDQNSGRIAYHHVFYTMALDTIYGSVYNNEFVRLRGNSTLPNAYVRVDVLNNQVWGLVWNCPVFDESAYLNPTLEAENAEGEFSAGTTYDPVTATTGLTLTQSSSGFVGFRPHRKVENKIPVSLNARLRDPLSLKRKYPPGQSELPNFPEV